MRLSVASLRRVVKADLTIQFAPQALTSYGGLELLRRYVHRIDLGARLRQAFVGLRGDYGSARLALLLLALFFVGGRRLEHLRYLADDPLMTRFCGLARFPLVAPGQLVEAVHPGDPGPTRRPESGLVTEAIATRVAPLDDRRRWVGHPHRREGRLGLSRLQPPSSERPELLPVRRPPRSDRPHPAVEEPPRQRA